MANLVANFVANLVVNFVANLLVNLIFIFEGNLLANYVANLVDNICDFTMLWAWNKANCEGIRPQRATL